jgi:hypothetical protein
MRAMAGRDLPGGLSQTPIRRALRVDLPSQGEVTYGVASYQ